MAPKIVNDGSGTVSADSRHASATPPVKANNTYAGLPSIPAHGPNETPNPHGVKKIYHPAPTDEDGPAPKEGDHKDVLDLGTGKVHKFAADFALKMMSVAFKMMNAGTSIRDCTRGSERGRRRKNFLFNLKKRWILYSK